MAGPNNTGQQIATHFFLHLLPIIIFNLARITILREQALLYTLVGTIHKTAAWHLQGRACSLHQKRVKRYKKPVRVNQENNKKMNIVKTYLLPFLFATYQVGCHVELCRQHFWHPYSRDLQLPLQGTTMQLRQPTPVCFDSGLFPVGIDNHASRCMADSPHLRGPMSCKQQRTSGWDRQRVRYTK